MVFCLPTCRRSAVLLLKQRQWRISVEPVRNYWLFAWLHKKKERLSLCGGRVVFGGGFWSCSRFVQCHFSGFLRHWLRVYFVHFTVCTSHDVESTLRTVQTLDSKVWTPRGFLASQFSKSLLCGKGFFGISPLNRLHRPSFCYFFPFSSYTLQSTFHLLRFKYAFCPHNFYCHFPQFVERCLESLDHF